MDNRALLSEPVLVLNRNYQPIHVCNVKRAMIMLHMGKVEVVENSRGFIHTPSTAFHCPSVIRLAYMVHRPRPKVKLTKREILRRDNYTCQYCGKRTRNLTVDHVIPRHLGGKHEWENLVSACPACNLKKGGRTPRQAGMSLLRKPREPYASADYLFGRYLSDNEEWRKFIVGW
ncbi:MAG: HNH endonuclease [Chloroflexota bacterium]|nr:HNH endonuclease [Chloroflexota bacterium]